MTVSARLWSSCDTRRVSLAIYILYLEPGGGGRGGVEGEQRRFILFSKGDQDIDCVL